MTEKNRGGRPTKEQQAAKNIGKSELAEGLRYMKKHFGVALTKMVEAAADDKLTPEKQFKMSQDIANMYMAMLRADKALIAADVKAGDVPDTDEREQQPATIFQLTPVR